MLPTPQGIHGFFGGMRLDQSPFVYVVCFGSPEARCTRVELTPKDAATQPFEV